jgi:uncharacterized protein DUF6600
MNPRSSTKSSSATKLFIFLLLLALPGLAMAQDVADPPSRVARLNMIEGSVSFQPAGTTDWIESNPNRPLTTGDQLWADQDSRGELHMGGGVLRISAQTGISFLNLGDQAVQIQVAQGSAVLRVLRLQDNENYEIDTPNLALTVLRTGEYRLDVSADGTSSAVTILSGSGEVTAGGQAYPVALGQQYTFSGTDQVNSYAQPIPGPDDFQQWNIRRDQREDKMASSQYVSRDVIGYEDLDDHGTWRDDPTYGHVWFPAGVAVGWAPYHYGHWAFVAPWGWTWVEDEPWGFAPFHYGRWAVVGGSWGWVPGPPPVVGAVYVRPVYAPALVAFVGGGGFAASISIGGGVGVAWFPLGPRDVWVPSYHVSPVYMTNVNVTNSRVINRTEVTNVYNTTVINNNATVNMNRTYTYQNTAGAVTAVPKASFQNGEPVAKASVQVNAQQIQHPQVVQASAMAPTPRSIAGPGAQARPTARPPATLASRPVVTRMAPSPHAIPVGRSAPPAPTEYHSMANAKPAATPPPGRPAAGPAPGTPGASGRPAGAGPGTGTFGGPASAGGPTSGNPSRPSGISPNAGQPGGATPSPGGRPSPPPVKFQPPTRENQPLSGGPAPGNPGRPSGVGPNAEQPGSATPPPSGKPAPPPGKFQPPTRENQPPAGAAQPTPNNPPPPARTNEPAVNRPAPPPPQAKKPGPPPAKDSKPSKESKDKEKDKDK